MQLVHADAAYDYVFARWRDTHQVAGMRSARRPAGRHFVALRDLVFDGETKVRQCPPVQNGQLPGALARLGQVRREAVIDHVGSE